ncbi:hypothetical protein GGS21DRAFT_537824 [Xylaria nigripes]|nr:hypothetical protein GGS21DRAFT_537824 [Xylaria nigripes]
MDDSTVASLRTSNSNPSLRIISNRAESIQSKGSHLAGYRHGLLKSNAPKQPLIKQELPVPPVLTHSHPNSTKRDPAQASGAQRPVSQNPTSVERPGQSTQHAAVVSTNNDGGDVSENGRHHLCEDHDNPHTSLVQLSQVLPEVYDVEKNVNHDTQGENLPASQTSAGAGYSVADHFQHTRMHTSKVRPFVDSQSIQTSYPHEGHFQTTKVRPYVDKSYLPKKTKATPISHIPGQIWPRGNDESQKVAIYWGLLPRFKDPRIKQRLGIDKQEAYKPELPREESSQTSQRSLTCAQPASPESRPTQENLYQEGQGARERNNETRNIPSSGAQRNETSIASNSPTSRSTSSSTHVSQKQESSSPAKVDTDRTTGWLRGLLGYSEIDSFPPLTRLPEKTTPRQQSQDEVSSIASGVTTYSRKNAVDKKAMNNAMRGLENLISEALSLANQVGEQQCGHIDDGGSPLKSTSEDSTRTLSIDESVRHSSSEHRIPTTFTALSNLIIPDDGNVNNGCTILLKPVTPRRLIKSVKRDDRISRPYYVKRMNSTSSDTEIPHHNTVYDDCVPPKSSSDRQARRDTNPFGPHVHEEDIPTGVLKSRSGTVPNNREVRKCIRAFHRPPVSTRNGSKISCECRRRTGNDTDSCLTDRLSESACRDMSVCSLDGGTSDEVVDFFPQYGVGEEQHRGFARFRGASRRDKDEKLTKDSGKSPERRVSPTRHAHELRNISLRNKSHVSIDEGQTFSFTKSARRQPTIARDWSPARKQFIASVACISTGLVGILVGIYSGLVPSIQYYIADFHHYTILGNVGLYLGMALPTLFFWPLPLLHGRKPYIAIAIMALLLSRALMGLSLGFATSLMSQNPHQEVVDNYDVRRLGGGLGVWLGIWTWCFIGSLSVGFPSWGLYISIIIVAIVLLLNRRSVAELRTGETTGPRWWGQEVYHGPGFTIMAVYSAWIYAQVVLIIVLLGSLTSQSYHFRSPVVGAVVSSVAIGASAAIPFQKANFFSRARKRNPMSNTLTFDKKITWSSHLIRRTIFTLVLPVAGVIYTVLSDGPPVHIFFPSLFAALVGFLSCLAISECNGMLMETWDCSDLQPGMTGRSRSSKDSHKRTNYSSFPRVTAGWNFIQSLGFVFAAGATGIGGSVTRRLGQKTATGIVAGILFILTLLLLGALARFKKVQIIPDCTCSEMDRWTKERRVSLHNWAAAMAAAKKNGSKALDEIPEDNSHLNRQAVALARGELHHNALHSMEKIMHTFSGRSLPSKCSHESSDEELYEMNKSDGNLPDFPAGPSISPPVPGPEPCSPQPQMESSSERIDAVGQTLTGVNDSSENVKSDSDHRSTSPSRSHASQSGSEAEPIERHPLDDEDDAGLSDTSRQNMTGEDDAGSSDTPRQNLPDANATEASPVEKSEGVEEGGEGDSEKKTSS